MSWHTTALATLAVLGAAMAIPTRAAEHKTDKSATSLERIVRGNNTFAWELYARLADGEKNAFFSPYSISTALAMTYAGARGDTAAQMAKVLGLPDDRDAVHAAFGQLIDDLNARGKEGAFTLHVANALWGQRGYGFLDAFLELTRKHYGAGLREVDFAGAPEDARKTINAWIEERTRDKIKDMIKRGVLKPSTTLVLTNAIYFKGNWASPFDPKQTLDEPFILHDGKKTEVPMMHQKAEFGYLEADDLQILELPYEGKSIAMLVLLPRKHDGLPALEKKLNAGRVDEWCGKLRTREVIVALPKFKLTCEFELTKTLPAMGMTDAFGGKADFSGMTGRRDLFIGAVLHKAFVDVNEEGTEAAAATAVMMERTAVMPNPPPVFRADHPFVFVIRDRETGSVLFVGRAMNPKAGS
jgi:serpin B